MTQTYSHIYRAEAAKLDAAAAQHADRGEEHAGRLSLALADLARALARSADAASARRMALLQPVPSEAA